MSFSATERRRLAQLLHELGPDAPTLCEGWVTRDMAAHLWIRENRIVVAAGMFVPALSSRLDAVTAEVKRRDYDELVEAWAAGPKPHSLWRLMDGQVNFAEHFIHHEDVRRANGQLVARDFSQAINEKFHSSLRALAKRMLKESQLPVVLYPQGFDRVVAADRRGVAEKGDSVVRVVGEVGELLLWVYGRDAVQVSIEGDQGAIVRSSL